MTKKLEPEELRRRADERLAERKRSRGDSPMETDHLLHELQVHQIELELQNEELKEARLAAEEALARYTDLFEYAPVGYLTVSRDSEIQQSNLTGARLLGVDRSELVGTRLAPLIAGESRTAFQSFLQEVFDGRSKEVCEVRIASSGAEALSLELVGTTSPLGAECRLSVSDISARKRAEELQTTRVESENFERIAGIAHAINNPLFIVSANLESLAEELPATLTPFLDAAKLEDIVDRLTDAQSGANRLTEISRSLSAFLHPRRNLLLPDAAGPIRGRILVVDDEPGIRHLLKRLLGKSHDVVTASSGTSAKALLETDMSFDMILSDLMMPGMTGIDLHVWLATANPRLAKSTVFVSGGAFTPGAAEYLTAIGNRVIEKPFESALIVGVVAEMVAAARTQPS